MASLKRKRDTENDAMETSKKKSMTDESDKPLESVKEEKNIKSSKVAMTDEQPNDVIMKNGNSPSKDSPSKVQKSPNSPPETPSKQMIPKSPKLQPSPSVYDVDNIPTQTFGKLVLEDGSIYEGFSFGAKTSVSGEVVFNTGMVGYPEALTDPSYKGQILVLTYPLVGNYGVPDDSIDKFGLPKHFESDNIQITALIITDYSHHPSHWTCNRSLGDWLSTHNIPALYNIDTRALTKKIRVEGSMLGKIVFGENINSIPFKDPNQENLVAKVSRKKSVYYGSGPTKIVAIDCGIKNNIIRYLVSKGIELKVVPWDTDLDNENYDGLFISNGPGDPLQCQKTIDTVRKQYAKEKPIFGICLGNQIMALAAGAKTYKMKFGNRGQNQPCIDMRTTLCYITPQNHGYAVDSDSLPADWKPMFINKNDNSNEGLIHKYKPFFSVQFHPEAMGGPNDTHFLFDQFLDLVRKKRNTIETITMQPPQPHIQTVLLLGSGGLSIGQAGEFDYSGSQAIKALKEENIKIILINPNIATVQTSSGMADKVYLLPVTPEFVSRVIRKEKPDGILLQFGGQTALNCGVELKKSGILEEYGVIVLGTSIKTIISTEDRQIFAQKLKDINEEVAPSKVATTVEGVLDAAKELGYPVLVRAAFALGGLGSGFADGPETLLPLARKAFGCSSQVIVDKSLKGWKEVEYEVVRDSKGNCITVCNMENFDPLGIHTGDSIVVAPSQTLTNREYFKLRDVAIKVVKHLGVIGECNIQYALDPFSERYCIIEVNARLSRSSALASKATGYPLAYVAAKLALGISLTDVRNSVTKTTTACFEPSLDYMVVKIPRWDMRKFTHVSSSIGSSMKSVGEVMAIGRTFEESFQKAIRMITGSVDGFGDIAGIRIFDDKPGLDIDKQLEHELSHPSDRRVFAVAMAMKRQWSIDHIHDLTRIDKWFLYKLRNIIHTEKLLSKHTSINQINRAKFLAVKKVGFSDGQIARCLNIGKQSGIVANGIHSIFKVTELQVRKRRIELGVLPFVKQIDTLAAEFPAKTNYLYMTYNASEHDLVFDQHGVLVLGCGPYRIGSSCEFDWCAVSCLRTLRKLGRNSIMINSNPETVSTDFDECDRLYFDELSFERVLDIYQTERAMGVVLSVGGQIPNNLAMPLFHSNVNILGTPAQSIDNAEDRSKFSQLLDDIGVDQPEWAELSSIEEAKSFAEKVGYPCLIRPSYVLSGAAMNVAYSPQQLENFLAKAVNVGSEHPVVISKFIAGAKEVEYDGVASGGEVINYAISEHVENAGVHSGDATLLLPAQKLYIETVRRVKKIAESVAKQLKITGPFNIQFLSKANNIKVIECNVRASRSFPFVSKTFNVNFIEQATKCILGVPVNPARIELYDLDHICCKAPMFSFTRLQGADPVLGCEMSSTGEVACIGKSAYEAFIKAMMATGFKLPHKNILVSIGPLEAKVELTPQVKALSQLGYTLHATPGTKDFYATKGLDLEVVEKLSSGKTPNILDKLKNGKIDLVINLSRAHKTDEQTDGYHIRRTAVDFSVGLISNVKVAKMFAQAMANLDLKAGGDHANNPKLGICTTEEYLRESKLL